MLSKRYIFHVIYYEHNDYNVNKTCYTARYGNINNIVATWPFNYKIHQQTSPNPSLYTYDQLPSKLTCAIKLNIALKHFIACPIMFPCAAIYQQVMKT